MGNRSSAPPQSPTSQRSASSYGRPAAAVSSPRIRFGKNQIHEMPSRDVSTGRFVKQRGAAVSSPTTRQRVSRARSPLPPLPPAIRVSSPRQQVRSPGRPRRSSSPEIREQVKAKTHEPRPSRSRSRSPVQVSSPAVAPTTRTRSPMMKSSWTNIQNSDVSKRDYASPSLVVEEPVIAPATARKNRKMAASPASTQPQPQVQVYPQPQAQSQALSKKPEDLLWSFLSSDN